jgi:hypothetical protein
MKSVETNPKPIKPTPRCEICNGKFGLSATDLRISSFALSAAWTNISPRACSDLLA